MNSVSFKHGKRCRAKQWYELNKINDEICLAHGLSIVEKPEGKQLPYPIYQGEKTGGSTRMIVARKAVDEAIAASSNMREFEMALKSMGYRCNFDPGRKYWTIKGSTWKKVMRLERLGPEYSNERIRERIQEERDGKDYMTFQRAFVVVRQYRLPTRQTKIKKVGGLKGLYLHYCYLLGYLPKYTKRPTRVSPLLKDDLLKLDQISEEARLLSKYDISTAEDLNAFREKREFMIEAREELRSDLRNKLRRKITDEERIGAKMDIAYLNDELKTLRKEIRLADGIEQRSVSIKEKIESIESEVNKNERRR